MARRIEWSDETDDTIIDARAGGSTWDAIAKILGVSRHAVIVRGHAVGAKVTPIRKQNRQPIKQGDREPMPPGHPVSWGAITLGTLLEGQAYRYRSLKFRRKPIAPAPAEIAQKDAA